MINLLNVEREDLYLFVAVAEFTKSVSIMLWITALALTPLLMKLGFLLG